MVLRRIFSKLPFRFAFLSKHMVCSLAHIMLPVVLDVVLFSTARYATLVSAGILCFESK